MSKIKKFFQKIYTKIILPVVKVVKSSACVFKYLGAPIVLKVVIWLLVVLAVTQFIFGVLIYGFKSEHKITKVAAKVFPYPFVVVNQDVVTYNDYLNEKDYIHHFYEATQQNTIDYSEIDKEILDQLIENKLLAFQAVKYGVKVSKAEVDDAMDQIIIQNGGEENVNKVLDDLYGLDIDDFRRLIKTQMIREKINTDAIEKITARHILIRVDQSATDEEVNSAKDRISGYLNEIKEGADFGEMAQNHSEDTGSAEGGGLLQPFAREEMVEEFSKAAFSTQVGQISEPMQTEFGWHIIKIEDKSGKIDKSFNNWLKELKKSSLVVKL